MQRPAKPSRRSAVLAGIAGVVIVMLMLLPLASGRDAPSTAGLHYIALGDSIPSGNAFPDDDTRPCQRSVDSYPWLVGQQLEADADADNFDFSHIACSGARVAVDQELVIDRCLDSLDSGASDEQEDDCQLKWLPNQVNRAIDELDGRRTLVTITVGANDTGWTDPLGLISLMLAPDDEFNAAIDDVADQVGNALEDEVKRLIADPNVTVILTDIYNPFNPESMLFDLARTAQATAWGLGNVGDEPCTGTDRNGVDHELTCAERAEYGLQALSRSIQQVAEAHPERVAMVSLLEPFRGHESSEGFCGDTEPASGVTWIRSTAGGGLIPLPDCFHPNTDGAEAIAVLIVDAWNQRRSE